MSGCGHKRLTLLKEREDRLRCRKCHLVLSVDELGGGCCPECYEASGERRCDFEKLAAKGDEVTRYRCDGCGAVIEWKGLD